ncbi:MAG: Sec-independent protein translocase protein TatB [bacterium]|nr:Sec-independent protein translocase protein TatB [bacterium]
MFDIGIGEIVIVAIIGLLIFGPERLPRAAADAAKWIKQMRTMATGARKDLADSAGIDFGDTVKSLQEFHPRNLAASFLSDDEPEVRKSPPPKPGPAFDPDAT